MITPYEQHKLILEMFNKEPGLYVPELSEVLEVLDRAVQNELKSLQRANERLRGQLASLQTRNDELEAYAHTVAHNLKNPLAVIITSCNLITDVTDLTPKEQREFSRQITSAANEMDSIIDNLLLLSEVSKEETPREAVDMTQVVDHIHRRLSTMVKETHGRISLPKTWPAAIGYAPWIEEVWAIYISNALKYGGQPPRVVLGSTTQSNGMIRFWARDNGPGMTPETRALLFTPFTQLSQVRRAGHGLGLSIARRIVEKLGGQVGVESDPGQGSLFYFTLPAVRQPSAARAGVWEKTPPARVPIG